MVCNSSNLIWLDLEMTGLSVEQDVILEIATIVTDRDLNVLAEGPDYVIHQSDHLLANMGEWVTKQHTTSGLVEAVKQSSITSAQAEQDTLAFVSQYVPKGRSPMCGNSICTDRRFLYRYMPELEAYFHYRHIDVSSLKELAKRWKSGCVYSSKSTSSHRALADIKDSIGELSYYRDNFIKL